MKQFFQSFLRALWPAEKPAPVVAPVTQKPVEPSFIPLDKDHFKGLIREILEWPNLEPYKIDLVHFIKPLDADDGWYPTVDAWMYMCDFANDIIGALANAGCSIGDFSKHNRKLVNLTAAPLIWEGPVIEERPVALTEYGLQWSPWVTRVGEPDERTTDTGRYYTASVRQGVLTQKGLGMLVRTRAIGITNVQFLTTIDYTRLSFEEVSRMSSHKGKARYGSRTTADLIDVDLITPSAVEQIASEDFVYHYTHMRGFDNGILESVRAMTVMVDEPSVSVYRAAGYLNLQINQGKDTLLVSDMEGYLAHNRDYSDVDPNRETLASVLLKTYAEEIPEYATRNPTEPRLQRRFDHQTDDTHITWYLG